MMDSMSPLDGVLARVLRLVQPRRVLEIVGGRGKYGHIVRQGCPEAYLVGIGDRPSVPDFVDSTGNYDEFRYEDISSQACPLYKTGEALTNEVSIVSWSVDVLGSVPHTLVHRDEHYETLLLKGQRSQQSPEEGVQLDGVLSATLSADLQAREKSAAQPLISIVITCFNKSQFIEQAVRSALEQTYLNKEVIVVDDGSSDGSWPLISSLSAAFPQQVIALHQENTGVARARDRGVSLSRGDYIVVLDGDDFLHRDALSTWWNYARANPQYVVVYSDFDRVDVNGAVISTNHIGAARLKVEGAILSALVGDGIVPVTVLIQRDVLIQHGGYSFKNMLGGESSGHEDYFLYLRMALAGCQFGYVPQSLLYYRDTESSLSKNQNRANAGKYVALQYAYQNHPAQMVDAIRELNYLGVVKQTELATSIAQAERFRLDLEKALSTVARLEAEARTHQQQLREIERLHIELDNATSKITHLQTEIKTYEERLLATQQATRDMASGLNEAMNTSPRTNQKQFPNISGGRLTRIRQLADRMQLMLRTEGVPAVASRTLKWLRGERRYYHPNQSPLSAMTPLNPAIPAPQLQLQSETTVQSLLKAGSPELEPIGTFYAAHPDRRLNLVTDSVNSGSLFGGVATSLILAALLANKWGCELRIITRTEKADTKNVGTILTANNIPFEKNIEFLFANQFESECSIPISENDLFLTTSWWTTESVRRTVGSHRILYLLQEDERTFYPYGEYHRRCSDVLRDPDIRFILNTQLLYNHFVKDGFTGIKDHGIWFEPSWPRHLFYLDETTEDKRNFFFYARPNHARNLFYLGIETIVAAINRNVLDPEEWNFHFVGKDLPAVQLTSSCAAIVHQNLGWADYARLVRRMHLGLSLMYSPHPSYPPIDLAASGAVVVTNTYGVKQNLDLYSENILCRRLDVDSLVEGLDTALTLVKDDDTRQRNYRNNHLLRDWQASFASVVEHLAMFNSVIN
jgi:GT2 family glycosyltransferase